MKTTIKEIRGFNAKDITKNSFEQCQQIAKIEGEKGGYLREIAWAPCMYGCGAKLYYGTGTNTFYKITKRTTALFCF